MFFNYDHNNKILAIYDSISFKLIFNLDETLFIIKDIKSHYLMYNYSLKR